MSPEEGSSFVDVPALLSEFEGEGSRSINEPVFGTARLGGVGGTGLRLGTSCAGVDIVSFSGTSEGVATLRREDGLEPFAKSAGVETMRNADGLIGFAGRGREVAGRVSPAGGG